MKAYGTASFVGYDIELQLVQTFVVGGQIPGKVTQIIRVEVPQCSSCKVVESSIDVASDDGRIRDGSHMAGPESEWCQIVDTATLPH